MTSTELRARAAGDGERGDARDRRGRAEGLLALAVGTGLQIMTAMMNADVEAVCAPKGKHIPSRAGVRHGTERGSVTLGGRRVPIERPRIRASDETGELPVPCYELFSQTEVLGRMTMARMLAACAPAATRPGSSRSDSGSSGRHAPPERDWRVHLSRHRPARCGCGSRLPGCERSAPSVPRRRSRALHEARTPGRGGGPHLSRRVHRGGPTCPGTRVGPGVVGVVVGVVVVAMGVTAALVASSRERSAVPMAVGVPS